MYRYANSTKSGGRFDAETIEAVWSKGSIIPGRDPRLVRMDVCKAIIERNKYGDTTPNGTGWEIDHMLPVALGGIDVLSNLQPLQWQNNRHKGDSFPQWSCAVRA